MPSAPDVRAPSKRAPNIHARGRSNVTCAGLLAHLSPTEQRFAVELASARGISLERTLRLALQAGLLRAWGAVVGGAR